MILPPDYNSLISRPVTGGAAPSEERGVGLAGAGGVALLPQAGGQDQAGAGPQQLPSLGGEETVDERVGRHVERRRPRRQLRRLSPA